MKQQSFNWEREKKKYLQSPDLMKDWNPAYHRKSSPGQRATESVEKLGLSSWAGGAQNDAATLGNSLYSFLWSQTCTYHRTPQPHALGFIQVKPKPSAMQKLVRECLYWLYSFCSKLKTSQTFFTGEWINKLQFMHLAESHATVKRGELLQLLPSQGWNSSALC